MRKGKETRKMDYRKFGNTYVIRMDRGEEIVRTLTDFCKKENVPGSILWFLARPGAFGFWVGAALEVAF